MAITDINNHLTITAPECFLEGNEQQTSKLLGIKTENGVIKRYFYRFALTVNSSEQVRKWSVQIGTKSDNNSSMESSVYNRDISYIQFYGYISESSTIDAGAVAYNVNVTVSKIQEGTNFYYIKTEEMDKYLVPGKTYYLWIIPETFYPDVWAVLTWASGVTVSSTPGQLGGLAKIYLPKVTGSTEYEYKDALVYIYTNGAWQLVLPYVRTSGTWKNTC